MLVILVPLFIGAVFFLANLAMSLIYDQKMSYLANQAAIYYAAQNHGWNYQNRPGSVDLTTYVQKLARVMGLNPLSVSARIQNDQATGFAKITVTGRNLPLLQSNILPGIITVQESSAADPNIMPRPTGLLSICVTGQQPIGQTPYEPTVLVPCYSGCFSSDIVASDPGKPNIVGPGRYDQFSFGASASSGAAMTYTRGNRFRTP